MANIFSDIDHLLANTELARSRPRERLAAIHGDGGDGGATASRCWIGAAWSC
jgi:hypothetical protein